MIAALQIEQNAASKASGEDDDIVDVFLYL